MKGIKVQLFNDRLAVKSTFICTFSLIDDMLLITSNYMQYACYLLQPPKKKSGKGKKGKKKKSAKSKTPTVIDGISTEEMSKEQVGFPIDIKLEMVQTLFCFPTMEDIFGFIGNVRKVFGLVKFQSLPTRLASARKSKNVSPAQHTWEQF